MQTTVHHITKKHITDAMMISISLYVVHSKHKCLIYHQESLQVPLKISDHLKHQATQYCTVFTFQFTSIGACFLVSFWSLDEKRKNTTKPQYVDKFLAVVSTLWTYHCMIENFQCTCARHFLLPVHRQLLVI